MRKTGLLAAALAAAMALPALAGGRGDLRGMEVVIGDWWSQSAYGFPLPPRNETEEMTVAHRRRIQSENNFTMRVARIAGWGDMLQTASLSIMAGNPAASVFVLTPGWAMTLHRQGLIAPIGDTGVDFGPHRGPGDRRPTWNQGVRRLFTFGGQTYGMSVGYGGSLQAIVVFFNKRLFREAGLDPELPYNMQRDRTWTWGNFLALSRQLTRDTTGDGMMDTWAMPEDFTIPIIKGAVASNNANFVGRNNQTGHFYNATGTPQFLEALQFVLQLRNEGLMMPTPEGAHWTWFQGVFADGTVAMRIDGLWNRSDLAGMTDDWGMVMFPRGPRAADYAVFDFENIMVVPATFAPDDVRRIVTAVEMWFQPVNQDPLAWQEPLWGVFRDRRAVTETMAIIQNPNLVVWQYYQMVPGFSTSPIAWSMWHHDGDPSQLIEAASLQWNALIADANVGL